MRTERGFDRLVNFSDAVVAIAITLLILPLVETATEVSGKPIDELLVEDGPRLLVFVISFAVIGRFWLAHHGMFEKIVDYNRATLWINLLWLLTIVFLPFPTELIAVSGHDDPTTTALYVGTMAATSLTAVWQQFEFVRHPELQAEAVRGTLRMAPSLIMAGMMLVVLVLVVLFPSGGLFWLFVLLLSTPLQIIEKRMHARRTAVVPGSEA
ncbi:TMEM175 family protein [Herbiconiux moechotypicola]|uniref:TMEM175 family protein n=1 Tax=Herbiconiux moechotypicola TaxID=637393 RepID=A0ABP5QV11_9MICO|nr:TMEM175 family protein [Herbiconiux moechotypicola]MCS5731197.1 TMEM175 family protein [Herbiconiux moechotypicola]